SRDKAELIVDLWPAIFDRPFLVDLANVGQTILRDCLWQPGGKHQVPVVSRAQKGAIGLPEVRSLGLLLLIRIAEGAAKQTQGGQLLVIVQTKRNGLQPAHGSEVALKLW